MVSFKLQPRNLQCVQDACMSVILICTLQQVMQLSGLLLVGLSSPASSDAEPSCR